MDANTINQVIDKVAEKAGIAAEQIAPLAEEVVRQFQLKSIVGGLLSLGAAIIIGLIAHSSVKKLLVKAEKSSEDWYGFAGMWITIGACILVGFFMIQAVIDAYYAVAPLYYCLKELF